MGASAQSQLVRGKALFLVVPTLLLLFSLCRFLHPQSTSLRSLLPHIESTYLTSILPAA